MHLPKVWGQNGGNDWWRSNLSVYQKSYGSTYGPLMHANSIQNEKLDDWGVFGDRFWGIRVGFVGLW